MSDEQNPQGPPKPQGIPAIAEPKTDTFTAYKKDPRLEASRHHQSTPKASKDFEELKEKIDKLDPDNEEALYDQLRVFKKQKHQELITSLETDPLNNRPIIAKRLTEIAEAIIQTAHSHVRQKLCDRFGIPTYMGAQKQTEPAGLSIIGMGKLGGHELNYHSDLDVIFVYSHLGETQGKAKISNGEFFAKLAQKLIHVLSVATATGRGYDVDTELRPSGHTGSLVTSYDHFIDHQMNRAQNWERQALLRARPLSGTATFQSLLTSQISHLNYERPLSDDFTREMSDIRKQVLKEKARESGTRLNLKLGEGGLMDIEFILHHIQLKNGHIFKNLQTTCLFDMMTTLKNHEFLNQTEWDSLNQALRLFHTTLAKLQIAQKHPVSEIDFTAEITEDTGSQMGFSSVEGFQKQLQELKTAVHQTYKRFFEADTNP